jgi:hypothetical protein
MLVQDILRRVTDHPIMCCTDRESTPDSPVSRAPRQRHRTLHAQHSLCWLSAFPRYALELLMRYWFSVVTLPERRSP